jgi:hypothetical protein
MTVMAQKPEAGIEWFEIAGPKRDATNRAREAGGEAEARA